MKILYALRHKETGDYLKFDLESDNDSWYEATFCGNGDTIWFTECKSVVDLAIDGGSCGWGNIEFPRTWNVNVSDYEVVEIQLP